MSTKRNVERGTLGALVDPLVLILGLWWLVENLVWRSLDSLLHGRFHLLVVGHNGCLRYDQGLLPLWLFGCCAYHMDRSIKADLFIEIEVVEQIPLVHRLIGRLAVLASLWRVRRSIPHRSDRLSLICAELGECLASLVSLVQFIDHFSLLSFELFKLLNILHVNIVFLIHLLLPVLLKMFLVLVVELSLLCGSLLL